MGSGKPSIAVFYLGTGFYLRLNPGLGIAALTLALVAFFVAQGLTDIFVYLRTRESSLSRWLRLRWRDDANPRLDDLATLAKQFTQGNRNIVRNQHDHERHHTADVDRGCAPCDEFGWAGSLIDEPS